MRSIVIFAEPGSLVSDGLVPTSVRQINEVEDLEVRAVVDVSDEHKSPSLISEVRDQLNPKKITERLLRRFNSLPDSNHINCRTWLRSPLSPPIPIINESNPNSKDFVRKIENISPDAILLLGCSKILSDEIINIPPLGVINYHWSYLPEYRGRYVTYWAAYNGESYHGVTFHTIDEEIDQGQIILRERVPVRFGGKTLAEDCLSKARTLLPDIIQQLADGEVKKQRAISDGEYYPSSKFHSHDPDIDYSRAPEENVRRIRANEGIRGKIEGHLLYITEAQYLNIKSSKSNGEVISITKNGIDISSGDGILRITELYYLPAWVVAKVLCIRE